MSDRDSATVFLPDRYPEELVLTFAGNVVKHLGVQMYSGRPVPAIAELVSNAWDADAETVEVNLPVGVSWSPSKADQLVVVSDDGHGMTWDMVRDAYLDVGRDRRYDEGTDRSQVKGRPVQGRKGIGKLAGFGIADVVEVQTVHVDPDPTINERALIWFELRMDDLKRAGKEPAPAKIKYAGPVSKAPAGARSTPGTTVTLRDLQVRRAINAGQFKRSMARRFLMLGPGFRVTINEDDLEPEEISVQWRWPEESWETDEVPGCGPVEYWIGFTEKPRKQDEGDLSGMLVYTRSKISQEATFFEISGGVTGQHGLRYLVGMVRAEWLDAGVDNPDLIATHRGGIAWESPQGQAFQDWGQDLIRRHLKEWAARRSELREKQVQDFSPQLAERIKELSPEYRRVAEKFVARFKAVEMDPEEFEEIFSWFVDALENATLRRIIDRLREADTTDLVELDQLMSRMEVHTAVSLLQVIEGNLAAIETLEKMHLDDDKERGVIDKHLEANPWLINPSWLLNRSEGQVAKWIRDEFGLDTKGDAGDLDRVDLFCVGVAGILHIVELKRGGHKADTDDLLQANRYRLYVLKRFGEITDPEGLKYGIVQSHLLAAELKDAEAADLSQTYADQGKVFFTTWKDLIIKAKRAHQQFIEILEAVAEG